MKKSSNPLFYLQSKTEILIRYLCNNKVELLGYFSFDLNWVTALLEHFHAVHKYNLLIHIQYLFGPSSILLLYEDKYRHLLLSNKKEKTIMHCSLSFYLCIQIQFIHAHCLIIAYICECVGTKNLNALYLYTI